VLAKRKALLQRALTTAVVAVTASTTAFAGAASADHPAHEECRRWAPHPHPFVQVVAQDSTFDTDCIEAPASRRFRIYLENRDRDPHNISIYSADPSKDQDAKKLFEGGEVGDRGRTDYAVDALEPGEYFFQDDEVPAMNGTVHVEEAEE
jgi:hypothetical protein